MRIHYFKVAYSRKFIVKRSVDAKVGYHGGKFSKIVIFHEILITNFARNHVSGFQSGEILVNSLRCRAMFQITGSADRGALRHVLLRVMFVWCHGGRCCSRCALKLRCLMLTWLVEMVFLQKTILQSNTILGPGHIGGRYGENLFIIFRRFSGSCSGSNHRKLLSNCQTRD